MPTIEKRGKNSYRIGLQVETPTGWEWVRETVHVSEDLSEAVEVEQPLFLTLHASTNNDTRFVDGFHIVHSLLHGENQAFIAILVAHDEFRFVFSLKTSHLDGIRIVVRKKLCHQVKGAFAGFKPRILEKCIRGNR